MYTLQMIVDQLNRSLISEENILQKDTIRILRIRTEDDLKKETLYLSAVKKGFTLCESTAGSSFVYHADLNLTLNRIMEIMEYYSTWEKELVAAIRRGCTLSELLDLAYPVISHPLFILDNNEWLVASTSALEHMDIAGNEDIEQLLKFQSSSPEKIVAFNQKFHAYFQRKDVYRIPGDIFSSINGHAMNLFHNDQFSGILLIDSFAAPLSQGKLDLFYLLGMLIQEMLNEPSSGLSISMKEASFLSYLENSTEENEQSLLRELRVNTWMDDDEKQLIFIAPASGRSLSPNLNHAVIMFNRLFGLKATEYQDGILLFLNLRILQERSAYEAIIQRIKQLSYCAGTSDTFTDIRKLPIKASRARFALLSGNHSAGEINQFKDHYMKYFFSIFSEENRQILKHPLLETLEAYDRRYGSSLYKTLFIYLKNERGITKTSEEMKIHRSTLIHRIERINELSEGILDKADERMNVLLSYYLEETS